jgi:AcrR family transcriptional regulator
MAQQTEDRRVRKTKKQLRNALTSLLLEKEIGRITVRDVADLADVNRGTFYAHYSDVYDLLHQLENDFMTRLDEVGSRHSASEHNGEGLSYLVELFTLAGEYSDIFYTLYCRSGDPDFVDRVFNKLKHQYLYTFLTLRSGGASEKLDYCASFIVAGMCTLVKVWIENGMRETAEDMARLGGEFIMHGVEMLQ